MHTLHIPRPLARLTRVSSAGQGAEDRLSLHDQDHLTAAACRRHNFPSSPLYCEGIQSSQDQDRPVLERIYADLATGQIAGVAVAEVNRLGRTSDPADCAKILNRLRDLGALLVVSGRDGTRVERESRLYDLAVDRDYCPIRDELIRAGDALKEMRSRMLPPYLARQRAGRYNGGPLPFWMTWETRRGRRVKDCRHPILDEDGKGLALEIVRLFLRLGSTPKLAVALNSDPRWAEFRPPQGWTPGKLRHILKNPRLAGLEQFRRDTSRAYHGKHSPIGPSDLIPSADFPPLISVAEWRMIQALLSGNCPNRRRATGSRLPLTGLLRCPGCNQPMRSRKSGGRKGPDGRRIPEHYYACSASLDKKERRSALRPVCCAPHHVPAKLAHRLCAELFRRLLESWPAFAAEDAIQAERDRGIELEALELEARENRLLDLIEGGILDPEKIAGRLSALAEDKRRIQAVRRAMRSNDAPPLDELAAFVAELPLDEPTELDRCFRLVFQSLDIHRLRRGSYMVHRVVLTGGREWFPNQSSEYLSRIAAE